MQKNIARSLAAYVSQDRFGRAYVMVVSQWTATDGSLRGAAGGKLISARSLDQASTMAYGITSNVHIEASCQ